MKKLIALLCLLLTLALPALAAAGASYTPVYRSTLQFIDELNARGLQYDGPWLDDGDECVSLRYSFDDFDTVLSVYVFFPEDCTYGCMIVYHLIDFDRADLNYLYRACNEENYDCWFVRFCVDESDYSVTAILDFNLFGEETGAMSLQALYDMVDACDTALERFSLYAK